MSIYWYDYETFGVDPRRDRPAPFAGIRTDDDLTPLAPPFVRYCQPPRDYLPHPDAALLTGILPQMALERGLPEARFMVAIEAELSVPGTCLSGYNNLRFDDEVTRFGFYRNLIDPYAHEWRHGNSRWDLIDVARMAHALRPEGIAWPTDERGVTTFRLERLTRANGIGHDKAHDAVSDVEATIEFARLLRDRQPRLYQFMWQNRGKAKAAHWLALGSHQARVHVSSRYPAERDCLAVVVALARHPTNANGVVVYDLSIDPAPLLTLEVEALRERLYTPAAELPEATPRLPLKTVHLNKCPALAPLSVLRPEDRERLALDLDRCQAHLAQLCACANLADKVRAIVATEWPETEEVDPETALYRQFIPDHDRDWLERLRRMAPDELSRAQPTFRDERLPELLFRYRARNFPETLSEQERADWDVLRRRRLTEKSAGGARTLDEFRAVLDEWRGRPGLTPTQRQQIKALEAYGDALVR